LYTAVANTHTGPAESTAPASELVRNVVHQSFKSSSGIKLAAGIFGASLTASRSPTVSVMENKVLREALELLPQNRIIAFPGLMREVLLGFAGVWRIRAPLTDRKWLLR